MGHVKGVGTREFSRKASSISAQTKLVTKERTQSTIVKILHAVQLRDAA